MLGSAADIGEQSLAHQIIKQHKLQPPVQHKLLKTARNLHSGLVWKVSCPTSPRSGPWVLWKSFLLLNCTLLHGTLLFPPAAPSKLCKLQLLSKLHLWGTKKKKSFSLSAELHVGCILIDLDHRRTWRKKKKKESPNLALSHCLCLVSVDGVESGERSISAIMTKTHSSDGN